ncbi:MAG: hypothetical protein QOJ19_3949 [Acidimicrobiia bacterium]|jgi:hypothetical protein|nr:hypothetical protein [Acidimicrobiia bacterium]
MAQLFMRAFAVVLGAFLLGLAVGWLLWRLHRRSVPGDEWEADQRALAELRRALAEVQGERDHLAQQLAGWHAEVSGLQGRISTAWHEREAAHTHAAALRAQLEELRERFDQASSYNHHLQRRVTELSLMVSRGVVARPEVRPMAPTVLGSVRPMNTPAAEQAPFPIPRSDGPPSADGPRGGPEAPPLPPAAPPPTVGVPRS